MIRLALIFVLLAGACSNDTAPLAISDIVINKPVPGRQMGAGYFRLTNNTAQSVVISHVTSPQFGSVEMHESIIEDGIARMVELDELELPPRSTVDFFPGGKHLMLLQPGDDLDTVTLEFHTDAAVVLSVNVATTE